MNLHPLRELAPRVRDHGQLQLAKYDQALKYAPNWEALKEARDSTAKQKIKVEAGEPGRPIAASHDW